MWGKLNALLWLRAVCFEAVDAHLLSEDKVKVMVPSYFGPSENMMALQEAVGKSI